MTEKRFGVNRIIINLCEECSGKMKKIQDGKPPLPRGEGRNKPAPGLSLSLGRGLG
jgi:hypothetical protein